MGLRSHSSTSLSLYQNLGTHLTKLLYCLFENQKNQLPNRLKSLFEAADAKTWEREWERDGEVKKKKNKIKKKEKIHQAGNLW